METATLERLEDFDDELTLLVEPGTLELLALELALLLAELDDVLLEFATELDDEFCDELLL